MPTTSDMILWFCQDAITMSRPMRTLFAGRWIILSGTFWEQKILEFLKNKRNCEGTEQL